MCWARSLPTLLPSSSSSRGLVEDVVDDLEEQAELGGEGAVRTELGALGAGQHGAAGDGGLDQAPGLEGVQDAQVVVVARLARRRPCTGRRPYRARPWRGRPRRRRPGAPRPSPSCVDEQQVEGLGEEAVAGEDRDVLAEGHVARRLAAAQRVVVDRRQVVMDQRVGVDELERGGRGQDTAPGRRRGCAPWPARARGGCACRRRAASSASPRRGGRRAGRRRSRAPAR